MEVAAKFRDHWISQPGQRGVKVDWLATWRNWCREEILRLSRCGTRAPVQSRNAAHLL